MSQATGSIPSLMQDADAAMPYHREQNLIERFFSKLKHFRRVATRYDKLAANFLVMVQLASMLLRLRAYEATANLEGGAMRQHTIQ